MGGKGHRTSPDPISGNISGRVALVSRGETLAADLDVLSVGGDVAWPTDAN